MYSKGIFSMLIKLQTKPLGEVHINPFWVSDITKYESFGGYTSTKGFLYKIQLINKDHYYISDDIKAINKIKAYNDKLSEVIIERLKRIDEDS
jgi:hypothetical protein